MGVIGLTGGIATGKSLASSYLKKLGANIIDTDVLSREVVMPGSPCLIAIEEEFGGDVIASDGSLDRTEMRKLIFHDAGLRHRLNEIVHPAVTQRVMACLASSPAAVSVLVVPLMVDSNLALLCGEIWTMYASVDQQIARATQRDAMTEAEAKAIIAVQPSFEEYQAIANRIIDNSGTKEHTKKLLHRAYKAFLAED